MCLQPSYPSPVGRSPCYKKDILWEGDISVDSLWKFVVLVQIHIFMCIAGVFMPKKRVPRGRVESTHKKIDFLIGYPARCHPT